MTQLPLNLISYAITCTTRSIKHLRQSGHADGKLAHSLSRLKYCIN